MALTHVCVWGKNGWRRINIEEAAKLHPYGSVSARSGLFMCELCGQYVTMTQANIRDSYFKHSRSEDDKNCPERSFGQPSFQETYNTLRKKSRGMPVKLVILNDEKFKFQVGFSALPIEGIDRSERFSIYINDP